MLHRKSILSLIIFLALLFSFAGQIRASAAISANPMLRIGLSFGANALETAHLQNYIGEGFELGYLTESMQFTHLGSTGETRISIISDHQAYGGYAMAIISTETEQMIYQYDNGAIPLAVRPLSPSGEKPQTWHRQRTYYGIFEFSRRDGGDITVVSVVSLQDHIKGVVPYEMSPSWPLEALKAQAVSARNYAITHLNRHINDGFNLCAEVHCHVYRGTGQASEATNRAVDETFGAFLMYNGVPARTFYYSSNGGATENSENVWLEAVPYLRGILDPYEEPDRIPNYHWSFDITNAQLSAYLNHTGVANSGVSNIYVSRITGTGNALSVIILDNSGRHLVTYSRESARLFIRNLARHFSLGPENFGFSQRFAITPVVSEFTPVVSGGFETMAYRLVMGNPSGVFRITGSGHGHNVGMSQWGARSMADLGYTFEQILTHYFRGTELVLHHKG